MTSAVATAMPVGVSSREPGQALRIMIGTISVLGIGMLLGLGLGISRLDDMRSEDAQQISDQQAALSEREVAVSAREGEAGVRESAVSVREAAVSLREAALK